MQGMYNASDDESDDESDNESEEVEEEGEELEDYDDVDVVARCKHCNLEAPGMIVANKNDQHNEKCPRHCIGSFPLRLELVRLKLNIER